MSRRRILVADDSFSITETLADILHGSGYEVVRVGSGAGAVQQINGGSFDLVLMDVQMPELDGIRAFQEIQRLNPRLPVLLMTAWPQNELLNDAKQAGVAGVFVKPLDLQLLLSEIERITLPSFGQPAVLIVDDDPAICQVIERQLTRHNCQVDVVFCATEALERVRQYEYDVVFLDICLPDANCLEVYALLKQLQPHSLGIMMTGYASEPHVRALLHRARQDGHVYLEKPFSVEQVLEIVGQGSHRQEWNSL